MSVIPNDVTGNDPADLDVASPVENATKLDHLLVDMNAIALPGTEEALAQAEPGETAAFHQATLALNVSDVIDLGTESIAGIDALIIHGEQGDTIRLANEDGYLWSRAENAAAPEGYDIYQANTIADHGATIADHHAQPVYVLIQHDLTVVLESA
jgi:hypothetical protein